MKKETRKAIAAVLALDKTVTPAHRRSILHLCDHPRARVSLSEQLLTADEAADVLGVNRRTIFRWMRSGRLAPIRGPGRRVRFRGSDLRKLM